MLDRFVPQVPGGQLGSGLWPRLAILLLLITAAGILLSARSPHALDFSWHGRREARPLQADLLYRSGLALQVLQNRHRRYNGPDPEDFLQSAIGLYERLALRHENPNTYALFRLAVIYAQQGNPEEGIRLLTRLIQLDETNAPLYMAVSSVYDTAPVTARDLEKAAQVLKARPDWVVGMVLPDLNRRAGRMEEARVEEAAAGERNLRFGYALLVLGLFYGVLALLGALLIGRTLFRKLFHLPPLATPPRLLARWGALDALEVLVLLVFLMAVFGLGSAALMRHWGLAENVPWAAAVVCLISYMLHTGLVLTVIRRRLSRSPRPVVASLGISRRLGFAGIQAGVAGYAVVVAAFVGIAILAHWAGVSDSLLTAAPTASELLERARGWPELAVLFVLMCLVAPGVEELIFRGYIYAGVRQQLPQAPAIVVGALLFAVAHVNLAVGGMAAIAWVGALLCYLYEKHRDLWPSIVAHTVHNTLAFAIIVVANL